MKYFLTLIALSLCLNTWAQDTNYVDPDYQAEKEKTPKQKKDIGRRVYYGGTLGLSFSQYSTSILIEPMIGFKMTEKLSTGVGIGFRYGTGDDRIGGTYNYTNYLGRLFARYIIIPKLYAHMEYMVESYDEIFYFEGQGPNHTGRTAVPFLFVGGGYRSQAGKGSFIFQVLFNVLQDNEYSSQVYGAGVPYISIGYMGGF